MPLNIQTIRQQFPTLDQQIDDNPLIYLDSAATALAPQAVLDAMTDFETTSRANVHRGMHVLAERATQAYEDARSTIQNFLNAKHSSEIIFTKNCTESINLVAQSWAKANLKKGDTVVLSILEHHSNIVPWLQLKEELGINIEWIEFEPGTLNQEPGTFQKIFEEHQPKLVSITGQSNVLGTRPPLKDITQLAHEVGAKVLVDAAQLAAHGPIDVQDLDCDFLAFSGHKLYGPMGIGVLYAKRELLEAMPAFLGGGTMIQEVHKDHFTPTEPPQKFEAGTPPITQAVGLAAAIDWLRQFDWQNIEEHEQTLLAEAQKALASVKGLELIPNPSPNPNPSGCFSFTIENIHPHDLTEILGRRGICLRAGHHCTQPLHDALGINATTRLSIGIYNTVEEINVLPEEIEKVISLLHRQ